MGFRKIPENFGKFREIPGNEKIFPGVPLNSFWSYWPTHYGATRRSNGWKSDKLCSFWTNFLISVHFSFSWECNARFKLYLWNLYPKGWKISKPPPTNCTGKPPPIAEKFRKIPENPGKFRKIHANYEMRCKCILLNRCVQNIALHWFSNHLGQNNNNSKQTNQTLTAQSDAKRSYKPSSYHFPFSGTSEFSRTPPAVRKFHFRS